jgi:DNA-binding NtrC family response regulator
MNRTFKPIILVMSSTMQDELQDAVFAGGGIPVLAEELKGLVQKLHRNNVAAIVVDTECTGTDALEVVLTARDLHPTVPIVVLETSLDAASASALQEQPHLRLLAKSEHPRRLLRELARLTPNGWNGES